MNIETIYSNLPEPAQRLATVLQGWRISRRRYTREFHRILAECRERELWSSSRLREFQNGRLRTIVESASRAPFFREMWKESGIAPDDIRSIDDLKELPVIDKAQIRSAGRAVDNPSSLDSPELWLRTSGTTGSSLLVRQTVDFEQR